MVVPYSPTCAPSLTNGLRRLERASVSKSNWVWAKAWHEASPDVIALLVEVGGAEALWGRVPRSLPVHPSWRLAAERRGIVMRPDEPLTSDHIFSVNVAGVPIPHPSVVAPLIPLAKLKIRAGRPQQFRRDLHIAEIVRAFERLSGTSVTKPPHQVGASRRYGPIIDFLDEIEQLSTTRGSPRHITFTSASSTADPPGIAFSARLGARNFCWDFRGSFAYVRSVSSPSIPTRPMARGARRRMP